MKVIGIDIGTTTISLVVLDISSEKVLASKTISNDSFLHTANEWERLQDAERIVKKAMNELDQMLQSYQDVASIGLTGQMHGIVYVDRFGKCISPLYTWQDGRGNLPDADEKTLVERVEQDTGLKVYSGYGLVTHLYQSRGRQVPKDAAFICTIGDYLGMCLTGKKEPLMHTSNAASLGFFDVQRNIFRIEVLKKLGIDEKILPQVCDTFERLGKYHGIPVSVAVGDNQASFLGSVGFSENTLLLNMGTGGQISVLSTKYLDGEGIEARPIVKGKYLLVGASMCGGRAYAILERFLREYAAACMNMRKEEIPAQYAVMEQLARKGMEQKDPMQVTTAFHGSRTNPSLRGSIQNLSEDNFTPEGLIYGVLEGMIRELYEMFQIIQKETGIHIEKVIASGNGLRQNKVLQEIAETMFDAKISLAKYQEEAACGAAVSSCMTR